MKRVYLSEAHLDSYFGNVLRDALEADGIEVSRAGDLPGTGITSSDILPIIKRCDLFIAMFQKPRPNVMLELGYALGTGKQILLIQEPDGIIPMDVGSFPVLSVDPTDNNAIPAIVEWVKQASVKPRPDARLDDDPRTMLMRMVDEDGFLDAVDGETFQQCIMGFFREMGFNCIDESHSKDKGYDFEIPDYQHGSTAIVSVKKMNRNSRLSVSAIQQLIGASFTARADHAVYVTSGRYTASAQVIADQSPIHVTLLTLEQLLDMTRENLFAAKT